MKYMKAVEFLECDSDDCNVQSDCDDAIDEWGKWPEGWTCVEVRIQPNEYLTKAQIDEYRVALVFCPECTKKGEIYRK